MSTIQQHADGVTKTIRLPVNYGVTGVTVDGGAVAYTVSGDKATVTLDATPAAGAVVAVTYHDIVHDDSDPAVLMASPATPQVLCSPITGDGDLTKNESISGIQGIVTGFIAPSNGIVTEVHFIAQRTGKAAGSSTPVNVRWSICTALPEPSSPAGIKVGAVLATGLTAVAPATLGDVTLASGLSVLVPKQFIVIVKAPLSGLEANQVYVQNCMSGGMIAGVFGTVAAGNVVSAATYTTASMDFDATTPAVPTPGDLINITQYKGLSVFTKWKRA